MRPLDRDGVDEFAKVVEQRILEVEEGTVTPVPSEEAHRRIRSKRQNKSQ
jgi:hypothetical protein